MIKLDEKGIAQILPLLVIVIAVGIISFLLIASTAPFNNSLFSRLFKKSFSHAASFSATDWPQVQYDAAHSGIAPQGIAGPYLLKWRFNQVPISGRVQPTVIGGRVYFGSNNGNFYALNLSDGSIAWQYQTGGEIIASSGFSYTTGFIYFGTTDGRVYALDTTKIPSDPNFVAWQKKENGQIRTAPLIANGKIYISSDDGVMHGLNEVTGNEDFSFPTDNNAPILEAVAAYDTNLNQIFFADLGSKAYSLDASTGTLKWKTQLSGQGVRGKWPVVIYSASGDKVTFSTMNYDPLDKDLTTYAQLLSNLATSSAWLANKQGITNFLKNNPGLRSLHALSAATGAEDTSAPILYTGGSNSPQSPPIGKTDLDAKVIYRYTAGIPYCGPTASDYSYIYLGQWNLSTDDIANLDSWNSSNNCSPNWSTKAALIQDETTLLSQGGNILYLSYWRGDYMQDLTAKTFDGIFQTQNDPTHYLPYTSPFYLFDSINKPGPKSEGSGEPGVPMVIANGYLIVQTQSTIAAIQGIVQ